MFLHHFHHLHALLAHHPHLSLFDLPFLHGSSRSWHSPDLRYAASVRQLPIRETPDYKSSSSTTTFPHRSHKSFPLGPHPRRFSFLHQLDMNHIGIAAHRTILDILLLGPSRNIHRNHNPLPTAWTNIRSLIARAPPLFHPFLLRFH